MYLELMHGRNSKDQNMDDWGFDGPVIGPLTGSQVTYLHQLRIWNKKVSNGDAYEVEIDEDMVKYDGKWYGDWCFIAKCPPAYRHRVVSLTKSKLELF